MLKLLGKVFELRSEVSRYSDNAAARRTLDMKDNDEAKLVLAQHLAAVLESESQADRGEFATDAQVAAVFRRFDR